MFNPARPSNGYFSCCCDCYTPSPPSIKLPPAFVYQIKDRTRAPDASATSCAPWLSRSCRMEGWPCYGLSKYR